MNYWVLLGILIIVIGFYLKLDVISVVVITAIVTGLIGGINLFNIFTMIGKGFITNRYMSLFLLTLPVIGLMERYGLKEKAQDLIKGIKRATAGKILGVYIIIRWVAAALSIRLGGHVQFIRPLILPMAEGAAKAKVINLTEVRLEELKGLSAAVENYGNFFGQNIFPFASGLLLIQTTLKEAGYPVTNNDIAFSSIYAGIAMIIIALIQCYLFERKLEKEVKNNE